MTILHPVLKFQVSNSKNVGGDTFLVVQKREKAQTEKMPILC